MRSWAKYGSEIVILDLFLLSSVNSDAHNKPYMISDQHDMEILTYLSELVESKYEGMVRVQAPLIGCKSSDYGLG